MRFRSVSAVALAILFSAGCVLAEQGKGQGKGHGKGHNKHEEADDQDVTYRQSDREYMRGWYDDHQNNLPPGLAKKDRLPPGLEKQLVRRGTLPPGLQKRIQPCPEEFVRRLPPPPQDCQHVLISGHVVLLNRKTNVIVDIFHLD